jgi:methionine-S-sulfoxide reductase
MNDAWKAPRHRCRGIESTISSLPSSRLRQRIGIKARLATLTIVNLKRAILVCALLISLGTIGGARGQSPRPVQEEKAIFAGGCFWCMQPPFDGVPGVKSTLVGYAGGTEANPTYARVSAGETGHREAIEVTFDPAKVTYTQLLTVFWQNINPIQRDGQFHDIGEQYTSAIFYQNEAQRQAAEGSKDALARSGKFPKPIATVILPAGQFWPAEEYHQKYYLKNRMAYGMYHFTSGRASFKQRFWGQGH